jgi:uncharacterized protein DUF6885
VASPRQLDITLLPGAQELLAVHARELPQRDDLCGAFCGALALHAAGIEEFGGETVDQDAVALAAGTVVSAVRDEGNLPLAERGRRDYRVPPPFIDDATTSGTTAGGLARAVEQLSGGALAALPYAGPWTTHALAGVFELAAELERPVTFVANLATGQLWGARTGAGQLLAYLLDGEQAGPPSDWEVGHFVCLIGRIRGPRGSLYAVVDTYPALGSGGIHLQPQEHLAVALQRPGMAPGGLIVVASELDAAAVRSKAEAVGLSEGAWDNGTATLEPPR